MDKANIERFVNKRVCIAAEEAIVEAIDELNAIGHSFASVGEGLIEWSEPASE
jgi:hypothetical protein